MSSLFGGQEITFTTSDGQTVTGTVQSNGTVKTAEGLTYEGVTWNGGNSFSTTESVADREAAYAAEQEEAARQAEEAKIKEKFPYGRPSEISRNLWQGHSGNDVKALQKALNDLGFNCGEVDGVFGSKTWSALGKFKDKYGGHGEYGLQDKTRAAFAAIAWEGTHYETGGLADFTGPAWLDGTKSRPEYILNADQTKAFFTLVDVLSGLQTKDPKASQNSGDSIYDIDINVESIGSDYDVEQIADTIKRLINEDARYRNNNAINLMR